MITPGKKLGTNFKLTVVADGTAREVAFQDLLTRRTIVSVYMKNNTGSCDKQNDALAAHAAEIAKAGYNLVAISRDTPGSHLKYAAKKKIGFPLVSDPKDLFAQAADSIVEKSMYGKRYFGPARAAFVLDTDGTVLAVAEKVDTADHAAQLKALIAGLK
ncbi:MAG: redoxin domain-containing protein [Undibacterium sp.]|nr:redoxin domain-containing protein [Opitutaceae bacterium]